MPVEPQAPVVVGFDASPSGVAVVDLAAGEAAARGVPLLILHVRAARQEAAQRLVASAARRVSAWHPDVVVRTEVTTGGPAAALLDRSRDAALLVVGHRGRHGGNATAGSVALRVLGRARVPVLVHRPFDDAAVSGPRPVLIGVDGTGRCEPVVEFGFAQAALHGVPLLAEHVWSQAADALPTRFGADGIDGARARAEAERLLADALAPWSDKYPDVVVRQAVRHSLDAAVALTAASRTAGLVVVGQTCAAGPGRLAGSVAQALVHRAGCPVAVVPTG